MRLVAFLTMAMTITHSLPMFRSPGFSSVDLKRYMEMVQNLRGI